MKKIHDRLINHPFFVKELHKQNEYVYELKDPKIADNTFTISINKNYDQKAVFPVWYSIYGRGIYTTPRWLEYLEKEINDSYYEFTRLQMTIHHHRISINNIFYFSRPIDQKDHVYYSTLCGIKNLHDFKLDQTFETFFQKTKKELEIAGYVVNVTSCSSGDGNLLINIK